jgi:hypothetical protein
MHVPFRDMLRELLLKDWDFLFRTNASSYVDLEMAREWADKLPRTRLYAGRDGGKFASGCGFFASRDVCQILADELTDEAHPYEDVLIGQTLEKHNIPVSGLYDRYDFNHVNDNIPDIYHYRCKSNDPTRQQDIKAMYDIHKLKMKKHENSCQVPDEGEAR